LPVRIEAAAYQGVPMYFAVVFPWQTEESTPLRGPRGPVSAGRVDWLLHLLGFTLMVVVVSVVAYKNWKAGRADVRGASRIGIGMFSALLLVVILGAHDVTETVLHGLAIPWCVYNALMCAMGYIAFEPWVRRQSPEAMITWSRALAGRWRDPVVGRDVLVGVLAAVAVDCLRHALSLQLTPAGAVPGDFGFVFENLMGARLIAARTIFAVFGGVLKTFEMFFVLFICRMLLRTTWAAAIAYCVIYGAFASAASFTDDNWVNGAILIASIACTVPLMLAVWLSHGRSVGLCTFRDGGWPAHERLRSVVRPELTRRHHHPQRAGALCVPCVGRWPAAYFVDSSMPIRQYGV
jgi:hypothetical protein